MALGWIAPLGLTAYWLTCRPTWKEFWPAKLMDIEIVWLSLNALVRSASRPPQPVVNSLLSGRLLCHWTCWSLWENSALGSGTDLVWNWALVVGTASVPTLARIASLPPAKRSRSSGVAGCRPNVRPSEVRGVNPSRLSRGSASAPRPLA